MNFIATADLRKTYSVAEYRNKILQLVNPLPSEVLPLPEIGGKTLAEDVFALTAVPGFDNSAMDGYAVRHGDIAQASAQSPVILPVVAELAAGVPQVTELPPGNAMQIMTGAPLPPGADTVVPVENTAARPGEVQINQAGPRGKHVRRAAEDVSVGDLVLQKGSVLSARFLAAAAAVGHSQLRVHRPVRVGVITTGSELASPGEVLKPGQIYDSNGSFLAQAVTESKAQLQFAAQIHDDPAALENQLNAAAGECDLIILAGGISAGKYDIVRTLLTNHGGCEFVKVRMQPGKPQGFGKWRGETPLIALPGNPVSVAVSYRVFAAELIAVLAGQVAVESSSPAADLQWAQVQMGWSSPSGKEQYKPVKITLPTEAGLPLISPVSAKEGGSHLVASLAQAQALAVVPEDCAEVTAGMRLRVMKL